MICRGCFNPNCKGAGDVAMRRTVEVTVNKRIYKWTQHMEIHCPGCGTTGMWLDDPMNDDYYLGEDHFCAHCKCVFTIQGGRNIAEYHNIPRYQQINQAVLMTNDDKREGRGELSH